MKKLLSVLLILSLCLTACAAFAEDLNEEEYVVLNSTGLKMWLMPGLVRVELDEEEIGYGYIDCFENDEAEYYIDVFCNPDLTGTLQDYINDIQSDPYFQNIFLGVQGDLFCLTYETEDEGERAVTAVFNTGDGHYIEIIFTGFDEETVNKMIHSIKPDPA